MKKIISTIFVAMLALVLSLALAACDRGGDTAPGTVVIAIEGSDGPVEYEYRMAAGGEKVMDALNALAGEGKLELTVTSGAYGAYVTSIGPIAEGGGKYIMVYTNVSRDFDVSVYAERIEYGGQTLCSSGVGVSEMSLCDGAIIYFCLKEFG